MYGDSRKKAFMQMITPCPIGGLTWRPSKSGNITTEIATHPFKMESQIHVWDLRRPFIPTKLVDFHDALVNGLLWVNEDIIWSISRDSKFAQHDLQHVKNPINELTFNALAISATGEIAAALLPRTKQKLGHQVYESDEDILYRGGRMQHGRSSSFRGTRTPSQFNLPDSLGPTMDMSQALSLINIPEFFDERKFRLFAEKWKTHVEPKENVSEVLRYNSIVCLEAGYHNEWKTWEMMRIAFEYEEKRAEELVEQRRLEAEAAVRASAPGSVIEKRRILLGGIAKTISNPSTHTTPISKPVPDTPRYDANRPIERVQDHLSLPPAAFASSLSSSTASNAGEVISFSSPLSRPELVTVHSYRPPTVEEQDSSSSSGGKDSSSGSSSEEEVMESVYPHAQVKPIHIKQRTHPKRDQSHQPHYLNTYSTGAAGHHEFGSGSYDDKPLVRDSDDEGSPEFGRSHKDDTLPSVDDKVKAPGPEKKAGVYVPRVHLPGRFVWAEREEVVRPWHAEKLIPKAIQIYTDAGDVQFAATVACLVARLIDLDYDQTDATIMAYIDLLHARQLFTRAAAISKYAPIATPRKHGMNGTFVRLSCGHCRKPILNEHGKGFWLCDNCHKAQDGCVMCRETVRGQWTFCQACGHGGHPECLRSWFVGEQMGKCPAVGCGHVCIALEADA